MRRWVYITCPVCERRMKPFPRFTGWVPEVHGSKGRQPCRLMVHPDPTGHNHRVHVLPREKRIEDAIDELDDRVAA